MVEPRLEQAAEVVKRRREQAAEGVEPRREQAAEAVPIPLLRRGARQGGVVAASGTSRRGIQEGITQKRNEFGFSPDRAMPRAGQNQPRPGMIKGANCFSACS